ncbi:uncharacterized protein LOC123558885 [Mercenaria mercenaria]|uniref:uncharacterized protein LOC123558885 n=1 Tax=Mercenaria mercenaria TaxID=6596 RepID=UPI001E1DA9C7|nr:uncharacterized protein LOC123558885 [Mercenaria mercenaria]
MGGLVCQERKPTSINKSKTYGSRSKSKSDRSMLKTPTYDEVPGICSTDTSVTNNDATLYETIRCVTSKKSHNNKISSSISDDKSYAKVLSVKGNLSTNDSKIYETVRSAHLTDSETVSSGTKGGTQYTSMDQGILVTADVGNTEQCTEQYCDRLHDMCALCASNSVAEQATHICLTCSKFGRYFCYKCLHLHNKFHYDHDVRSLSAPMYDKRFSDIQDITKQLNKRSNSSVLSNTSRAEIRSQNTLLLQSEIAQHCQYEMANFSTEETNRNYKTANWINEATSWNSDRPSVQNKERKFTYGPQWNTKVHNCCNQVQNKQYQLMNGDDTAMSRFQAQAKDTYSNYVWQCELPTQHYGVVGKINEQLTRTWKYAEHSLKNEEHTKNEENERSNMATDYAENATNEAMRHERRSPKLQHSYQLKRNGDLFLSNRRHESVNRSIKISTQFLELYNKEWADGINTLVHADKGNKTEQQACELLLRVLTTIYLMCKEKVQINPKSNTSISSKNKTEEIATTLQDERRKQPTYLMKEITREVMHSFQETLPKEERLLITQFIIRCAGVCFLMVNQEPQFCIDTNINRHGEHFDASRYKAYRAQGNSIDYIVWPVLYLEDNGTIVNKGIVQVMKQDSCI